MSYLLILLRSSLVFHGLNGFVVTPGDTKALADAMTSLLSRNLREQMGLKSFEIVNSFCDPITETKGYTDAINCALDKMKC